MKIQPPPRALKFLRWFCRTHYLEEIEGDLIEIFEKLCEKSPGRAKRNFAWNVMKYFRPEFIKSFRPRYPNPTEMTQHNLLISYRNFKRYKTSFFINLIGLSTGLACSLIIYLWVNDELQVDRFNEKDAHLYRVMENSQDASGIGTGEGTPGILAKALSEEIPEIEFATSVVPAQWFANPGILTVGEKRVKARGQYVDREYFDVFSCTFLQGDKRHALSDKYAMAVSESLALKLFNTTENVIGKTVEWKIDATTNVFQVTGIFKDTPAGATAPFDVLLNYEVFMDTHSWLKEWGNSDPRTFVIVRDGTDVNRLNNKIAGFIKSKYPKSNQTLFLQGYADKYLHGRYENGTPAGGRIEYVRLFSTIAVFLLVIACINFMNLSTARASRRVKEIGIKKAIGAGRSALIFQYLQESMLMTFLSLTVAVLLVILFLPQFNNLTGKALTIHLNSKVILTIFGITLFTGLISGSYPALYLSGFRPAVVLKGKLTSSIGELLARKGLVVFQFAISVILIVSVVVVYKQIEYLQSKNLGYDRDHTLHFEMEVKGEDDPSFFAEGGKFERNVESFLQEIKGVPGVVNATNAGHDLTGNHGGLGGIDWKEGTEDEQMLFSNLEVGYNFIETMGIEMEAGRAFSRDFGAERSGVIFNRAAIDRMGLKDPVGKTIKLWGQEKKIIGVARNFHFESLYEKVKPCVIQLEPRSFVMVVKINGGAETETINRLQKLYHQHTPGLPFDYRFIDDDYQALYLSEQRVSSISRYFASIAILISCLGLFGLAAFSAERRVKEIGIRKILGSGEWRIIYLLSGDFTRMVLTAIVVALPASYFVTTWWLNGFAYRIPLQWSFFIGAGMSALLIAWFTVGLQTVKAARINPVNSLRTE